MIIVMKNNASAAQINNVVAYVEQSGCQLYIMEGVENTIIGLTNNTHAINTITLEQMNGVLRIETVNKPYKLASREFHPFDTVFPVDKLEIGGVGYQSSSPAPARWKAAARFWKPPMRLKKLVPICCVAEHSNHAPHPTPSRA